MSDRYTRRLSDGECVCRICGVLVGSQIMHDLFHNRFNLMYDAIPASLSGDSITTTDWQAAHDAGEDEELRVGEPFTYPGERVIATVVQWDTGFGFTVYDTDGNEASSGAGPLLAVIAMLTEELESYYKEARSPKWDSTTTTTARAAMRAFADWESPEDQVYDEPLPDLPNEEEPRKCAICAEEVRVTRDGHPYHYSTRADIGDHHATLDEFEHGAFCECPRCNEQHGAPVKVEQTPNPAQTEPPVGSVARCTGCGNVYIHKPHGWWNSDDGSVSPSLDGIKRPSCGPLRVIYNPEEAK